MIFHMQLLMNIDIFFNDKNNRVFKLDLEMKMCKIKQIAYAKSKTSLEKHRKKFRHLS